MANNLVDNTNYGFTKGVPESTVNQEPLKKCGYTLNPDFNSLTTPGFYSFQGGTNGPTLPSGGSMFGWFLMVIPTKYTDDLFQLAFTYGSASNVGIIVRGRTRIQGVWQPWKIVSTE